MWRCSVPVDELRAPGTDDMPEPRPGASGCYRDVAVFLLVVVPLVAAALGLAAAWRKRA
jgi:hypothetical protein